MNIIQRRKDYLLMKHLINYKYESVKAFQDMDMNRQTDLLEWCKQSFKKRNYINYDTMPSDELKKLYEKDNTTLYSSITNEEFKGAMLYLGYKYTNEENMRFNISIESETELRHRISDINN